MSRSTGFGSAERRYDFDWLRVFGAVMVVLAHAAGLFTRLYPPFGSLQKSKLFDELLFNLNLWLMPLFMLLAGAAVRFTLAKRSNSRYLRERLLHLGLPAVVLTLTFSVPAAYCGQAATGQFTGSLADYYLHFFDKFPSSTFHLWFLFYLLIYAALTLPLFRFLQSAAGLRLIDKLARLCSHMGGLYVFALPLLAVQLAMSGLSRQAPLAPPPNDWTRFILLLLVFIFGYILVSDSRFQQAIARQWPLAAVVALITSGFMFTIAWPDAFDVVRDLPVDYSFGYATFWTVFALSSWSWVIACLGFGQRFLNVNHPLLKRAAAASYPLYLLHPVVMFPSLLLVSLWPLNAFVGFGLAASMTIAGTLGLSAVIERCSVTRLLFGLKPQTARTRVQVVTERGDSLSGSLAMGLFPSEQPAEPGR